MSGNRLTVLVIAFAMLMLLSGCTDPERDAAVREAALHKHAEELTAMLVASEPEFADGVRVSLAFGVDTDLDLYVTDPLLETVYFANHETESGGVISDDVRCDVPGPRIETVYFESPLPGRYRVGVDYPESCSDQRDPVAYAVSVKGNGLSKSVQGTVEYSRFKVIVLEFEVSG